MKLVCLLLLCISPLFSLGQYRIILNTGDTATVSSVIEEGAFYTIKKQDGRSTRLAKDLVRAIVKDYSSYGTETTFLYCELVGIQKFLSTQVNVSVDYGQERHFFQDNRMRNADGNIQSFNSMVDALNYMGSFGWEFVQAYVVTTGQQNVYRWLLKKKK